LSRAETRKTKRGKATTPHRCCCAASITRSLLTPTPTPTQIRISVTNARTAASKEKRGRKKSTREESLELAERTWTTLFGKGVWVGVGVWLLFICVSALLGRGHEKDEDKEVYIKRKTE
jgi:hypothetical protein